ncbi:Mannose-1-phosphate guanylyltransferase [Candidatus Desulforudis audaxviator]|nr:sugar phosphate nucleotidyltransferase [Candidatus Desulforudis audaxviator]AZK59355.1 Mannose-1-phosphate guanylyltransferase [Candidatus Desulforudis audaxviator]
MAVIMAGGVGTRFWPLSTEDRPKQFLQLFGERSLLQQTRDRLAAFVAPEHTLVLTNERFTYLVRAQLPEIPEANIIGEPARRDTAGAVTLAALLCRRRFGDPAMIVLPADHVIQPVEEFQRVLASALEAARREKALYAFGIPPTHPATGYGYLERGEKVLDDGGVVHYRLLRFKEKPDAETARAYVDSGRFFWNSGIFVWTADTILEAVRKHLPGHLGVLEPLAALDGSDDWTTGLRRLFPLLPAVSIDYGVMEKAENVRAVAATFSWSDVGGWTALEPFLEKDTSNNACRGRVRSLKAGSNIVFCEDPEETVSLIGVRDLIVVRAGKQTLVVPRQRAEELKELAEPKKRTVCFKAYDIRGRVPDDLNEDIAYAVGQAYTALFRPARVVVGRDVRHSSPPLSRALIRGLTDSGVDVLDIGLCGTEQVYFATFDLGVDGGIMVTASHNPVDYNGMKLVRKEARPVSGDSGLREMEALLAGGDLAARLPKRARPPGRVTRVEIMDRYVAHLLRYVDVSILKPYKVVCNAGNGGAGLVIDALEKHLPFRFSKYFFEPDGTFPNGVPNPLLPENRRVTSEAVLREGADIGIAWDGDFDRCFLFDEKGAFVEGYYIVGLLAGHQLALHPGAKIIHDPRLTWNTIEIVRQAGGIPVLNKTGHAFIKERMRAEDAVYGGEMSAHHYFRDFAYCDSGMIPWLLVLEIMSRTGKPLSELVGERMRLFPISGEINRSVADPAAVLARVRARYEPEALNVDETDGISLEFERWRFNLRLSNTEPVVRLNVETRGDEALLRQKTAEILAEMDGQG